MGFVTDAIDYKLWLYIEECAKENNIDNINIRHLAYGDDNCFVINGKLIKPTLQMYTIPDIPMADLKRQINDEIKYTKANAIILGKIDYEPFTQPIGAEMWFGRVDCV